MSWKMAKHHPPMRLPPGSGCPQRLADGGSGRVTKADIRLASDDSEKRQQRRRSQIVRMPGCRATIG